MLHFLRPIWFLMLIPLILAVYGLYRCRHSSNQWQTVIDPVLLPHLLNQQKMKKQRIFWWIVLLVWMLTIFILAGPVWQQRPQPVYHKTMAKVILLDLSPSMLATDIKPSRLTRAKYKVLDILQKYSQGQTGLAVFSGEAYTVSPLTNDPNTIALMVPKLSPNIMPVQGSNLSAGLSKAGQLLQQGQEKKGLILAITDTKPDKKAYQEARRLHSEGYTISVLGIGTKLGAPIPYETDSFSQQPTTIAKLDVAALKVLAKDGGGRFSDFRGNDSDLAYLIGGYVKHSMSKSKKSSSRTLVWIDEGRWFIWFLLPFALYLFRKGWLESL